MIKGVINLFVFVFLVLNLVSCNKQSASIGTSISTATLPNIIFIIADDMGWDAFGNYPNTSGTKAITPTLDSLARSGVTFNNCWVNPECSPTRAAILTGKYGFRTNVGTAGAILANSETIIQKYISNKTNNAYANAVIGKWHVSQANQLNAPTDFGIQYFAGIMPGALADYYNWTENINGINQTITTYATTQLVNQSTSWIQQQTKPFFLWLAFNAPHTPFHRPPLSLITNQSLVTNQTTINANPLPYYLASIEAMDKEIARLISSLSIAQKENTVFVVIGDNGTTQQVAQTPYISTKVKSTLYQGGVNTPLIICGKNVTRKNIVETAMIQAPDLFATFADLAGAGSDNYQDGISIKPLFTNANASKRSFIYTEIFGSTPANNDGYALRNENYKLIHLQNGTDYFYNISIDPFEKINLMTATLNPDASSNLTQLRQIKAGL